MFALGAFRKKKNALKIGRLDAMAARQSSILDAAKKSASSCSPVRPSVRGQFNGLAGQVVAPGAAVRLEQLDAEGGGHGCS